jgi:DnaJ like chaperone protein
MLGFGRIKSGLSTNLKIKCDSPGDDGCLWMIEIVNTAHGLPTGKSRADPLEMCQKHSSGNFRGNSMSFWERIIGPGTATSIESVLGRLTGLLAGDSDDGRHAAGQDGAGHEPVKLEQRHGVAFTIAVVALGAKMAKADGLVTPDEVAAFKQVFTVAPQDLAHVGRVFDLARQDTAGFETYAQKLAHVFKDDKTLLRDVLEGLFHIASADDVLHPAEDQYLGEVARLFGFSDSEYRYTRGHFVAGPEADPWHILGISPEATNDELRTAYRKLVVENHPDRYTARGLPAEAIEIANRKLAAINGAYAVVARERGLK